ncbi:Xylulose kinase [Raoultella planticola]|uniref:Xylulose kinase n=1 Tax=Raoultella planticola TaxID=575 RepID=A0A485B9Q2_RAOPL|nr:Xylulose kinase [Raoultella planticola]
MWPKRDWSDELLAACGLSRDNMPALFEGCEVTGTLRPAIAQAWNMPQALVVAGGGDNAAGAVGVGMADAGQAMLSLGTSGVYFAVSQRVSQQTGKRCTQLLPRPAGTLAFDVGDVERRFLPRLGGKTDRPRHGSCAAGGGGIGA